MKKREKIKKSSKLKSLSIGFFAFIYSYSAFLGSIHGEDLESINNSYILEKSNGESAPKINNIPSMIADRSNEGRVLQEGTSFYAITNEKIVKVASNNFKTAPKTRIYLNGKETLLDMQIDSKGKNYEVTLPENLDFDTILNTKNGLQIIGELTKKPMTNILGSTSGDSFTTTLPKRNSSDPGRVIINNNKSFIGNYDYLPLVITNQRFTTNRPMAIYLEYEKIDDPKYEKDPDVMKTGYEPRILYGAPSVKYGDMATTFYIKTPYGYKTNIYGLKPSNGSPETILINEQGGIIKNNPTQYISFTSRFDVPMFVINPNTGDITLPEFMTSEGNGYKTPSPKEVEYFNTDPKEDKENTIKSGITFPEDNPHRPIKYEILSPIPEDISDTPVNVKVKLFYKDGSSLILDVPVVVKKSNKPVPPQPQPADANLDPHINLLHDRYTLVFAMQDTLRKRLGDLRENKEDRGIWVRNKKEIYHVNNETLKSKFNGIQVGYDSEKILDEGTSKEKNRHQGIAFEHLKGKTYSSKNPATNELQGNIFSIYQTDIHKDGRYLDLVAKLGKVRDKMKFEDETTPDDAIWRSTYYSLSAEYGKLKQKDNYYIEPQVQLTYSHLGSSKYTSDNQVQGYLDSVNSLVLRSGILLGKKDKNQHIYGKVFVNHEFLGRTTGNYTLGANNQNHNLRNRGNWVTIGLGVQKHFDKQNYFYFDVERDFGKKLKKNWGINGGLRHMF